MQKIIVITGPTGVGKTKLSIELAKKYNGEIINADSMQIYRELNIGTAKIREDEKENIPHHLFDIKNVDEEYTIYHYQKDLRNKIDELNKNGKRIIIVGGTALYLKAGLFDYTLEESNSKRDLSRYTDEELVNELKKLDKDIDIDFNNRRRVERAYNYYLDNNKSITKNTSGDKLLYSVIFIGLTTNRDNLYKIINKRVDEMVSDGLVEEVKGLYDRGIHTKPLINGIGYKELYSYFDKDISLEDAIEKIKQNSRKYAKRQYTFFNNKFIITWFKVNYSNFNETINEVEDYINKIDRED